MIDNRRIECQSYQQIGDNRTPNNLNQGWKNEHESHTNKQSTTRNLPMKFDKYPNIRTMYFMFIIQCHCHVIIQYDDDNDDKYSMLIDFFFVWNFTRILPWMNKKKCCHLFTTNISSYQKTYCHKWLIRNVIRFQHPQKQNNLILDNNEKHIHKIKINKDFIDSIGSIQCMNRYYRLSNKP